MHTSRITNTSLFVTVLSACLSLLMTGAPAAQAHAQQQDTSAAAANKSQALAAVAHDEKQSPDPSRKLAAASNSYFRVASGPNRPEPRTLLYKNSRALADRHQVLVVTRLPRAGLPLSLLAEQTERRVG